MAVDGCGDICALPEDCIAKALSLAGAKDVCRLSAVSSKFRSVAESDAVWERFLPANYRDMLSGAADGSESLFDRFRLKKELYLHLCDHPVLIDGGRKSFSLDKLSGKTCFMLSARDLFIVLPDTPPENWKWISHPESKFSEVAELRHVRQFEIQAKITMNLLSSGTNYTAYLVYNTISMFYGYEQTPAEAFLAVNGNESEKRRVCLDPWANRTQTYPMSTGQFHHRLSRRPVSVRSYKKASYENTAYPTRRDDGWLEVELGEWFVCRGENGDLELTLMDENRANRKSGIFVEGIDIRPKLSTTVNDN